MVAGLPLLEVVIKWERWLVSRGGTRNRMENGEKEQVNNVNNKDLMGHSYRQASTVSEKNGLNWDFVGQSKRSLFS